MMIITIKLDMEAPKSTHRRSISGVPRKEHINAERDARLRRWLDETPHRAPWNALVNARSGLSSMN
jgi:hypothetical protein